MNQSFLVPIDSNLIVSSCELIHLGEIFEDLMQHIFQKKHGEDFLPIGGTKDGARDGRLFLNPKGNHLYQFSIEGREKRKFSKKVEKTVDGLKKSYGNNLNQYRIDIYFSYRISTTESQKVIDDYFNKEGLHIQIRGADQFAVIVNESPELRESFWEFIEKKGILNNLESLPTSFTRMEGMDSTLVYLSYFMENDDNQFTFVEQIIRNSMYLSLKDTNPDINPPNKLTYAQVVDFICAHSPFIPRERAMSVMLKILSQEKTKNQASREFRNYESENQLCLSYRARIKVAEVAAEAKLAEINFVESAWSRLPENTDLDQDKFSELLVRCLAKTYCDFGIEMISYLQKTHVIPSHDSLDSIVQQVCHKIENPHESRKYQKHISETLYSIIWRPTDKEKHYCYLMSRSYSLLFTSKGDQSVIQYLESSARGLIYILGTDIIIKIFSEVHLEDSRKRYTNMVRSLGESGIKFHVTDPIIREAAKHVGLTLDWYEQYIQPIVAEELIDENAPIVRDYLEKSSPKILIRAFYHARKDGKFKGFKEFIATFVSANKNLYKDSILSYLEGELSVKTIQAQVDPRVIADIKDKLLPFVGGSGDQKQKSILAGNDASTVGSIYFLRDKFPNNLQGTLFRHRVWWLTEEKKISRIRNHLNERYGEDPYIHPEIACSLLANLPSMKAAAKQLHTVLSSAVGLQLSTCIDETAVKCLVDSYNEVKTMSQGTKTVRMRTILHEITTNTLDKNVDVLSALFNSKQDEERILKSLKVAAKKNLDYLWKEISCVTEDPIYKVVLFCISTDLSPDEGVQKIKDAGYTDEIKGISGKMISWLFSNDLSQN